MTATVYVKNIAASTGDAEIKDFFSFWFVYYFTPRVY